MPTSTTATTTYRPTSGRYQPINDPPLHLGEPHDEARDLCAVDHCWCRKYNIAGLSERLAKLDIDDINPPVDVDDRAGDNRTIDDWANELAKHPADRDDRCELLHDAIRNAIDNLHAWHESWGGCHLSDATIARYAAGDR